MTSAILCASTAAVLLLIRVLTSGELGDSPAPLLNLAQAQLQQGRPERALATLQRALERHPDAATRARIEEQMQAARAAVARAADRPVLDAAARAYAALLDFERVYLRDEPAARGPGRELVRNIDRWLETYAETCRRHPDDGGDTLANVTTLRARYARAAQLDQPDDAGDVLFRAHHLVHLRDRRYGDAVGDLDAFLAAHPGDPRAGELRARREALLRESEPWVQARLRLVDRMIERNMLDDARAELAFLREHGLPSWEPWLREARAKVERSGR